MIETSNNNHYLALEVQVHEGINSWDKIFFGEDKESLISFYKDMADSMRHYKAFYINKKHRLLSLSANNPNASWLLDMVIETNENDIKKYSSLELRYLYRIDSINGVKHSNTNYFDLQAIKQVPISQFLTNERSISSDKSLYCCPLHNEKTPSFHYYKKQNSFACYGCGKAGDNIQFIMELNKLTFKEACVYLSKMI